jgi:hypothetical protein
MEIRKRWCLCYRFRRSSGKTLHTAVLTTPMMRFPVPLSYPRCFPRGLIDLLQNARGPSSKYFACHGQPDAPVRPFHEPGAQLLFQFFDLVTKGGLRDIQQQCGFGEMELLRKNAK